MMQCKDCDVTTEIDVGPDLIKAGWDCININDDEADPVNGWRCPKCTEGWRIIVEEQRGNFHS